MPTSTFCWLPIILPWGSIWPMNAWFLTAAARLPHPALCQRNHKGVFCGRVRPGNRSVSTMCTFLSRTRVFLLSTSVAIGLAGCAQKRDRLAYDNFTQIRTQVHSRDDVEAILGEPDQRFDDRFMYERPDKHLHVFLEFDA